METYVFIKQRNTTYLGEIETLAICEGLFNILKLLLGYFLLPGNFSFDIKWPNIEKLPI